MPTNSYLDFQEDTKRKIDDDLVVVFSKIIGEAKDVSPLLVPLVEKLLSYLQGGKRIRGTLIRVAYEVLGEKSFDMSLIRIGLAYEFFHAAMLIHDDIIDESELRRGNPSLHKLIGGGHYGISQSICLGDLCLFYAKQIILESNLSGDESKAVLANFSRSEIQTAYGQMLDILSPQTRNNPSEFNNAVSSILKNKTSIYSVAMPLKIGASLAKIDDQIIKKLYQLGISIGMALQIKDDINGIFSSVEKTGKISTDIEEGKTTYLSSFAFEHASNSDLEILNTFYGNKSKPLDLAAIEEVKRVFRDSGALRYAESQLSHHVKQSYEALDQIDLSNQKVLKDFIGYVFEYQ